MSDGKRHTISADDAELYSFTHQIAGAFGGGEHKELVAVVTGTRVSFEVRHHREAVLNTSSLRDAVHAYNEMI